jgi:two-component system response regulator
VLRQLRANERTRHLPVVVMTTSGQEGDIRQSYDLGANGYLRKPADYREFAAAIKTTLTFWLRINQAVPVPVAVPAP